MEHKCPKCGSIIYSRRNVLCGVCGERLPAELLFTAEQREAVERDLADAKRRAKQAASASDNLGGDVSSSGGFLSSTDFGSV